MAYELIVPSIAETKSTGFLGGIEREHRGRKFRVEFWRTAPNTRCTKNGAPIRWEDLPSPVRSSAHSGAANLKAARDMARTA
jgi:hypothetical protein